MIKVGLNGFGRIGKCVLLQLLNNDKFSVCCLNAMNINIHEIEDYLSYDTVHGKHDITVEIINVNTFKIKNHIIKLISERDAKKINWREIHKVHTEAKVPTIKKPKIKPANIPNVANNQFIALPIPIPICHPTGPIIKCANDTDNNSVIKGTITSAIDSCVILVNPRSIQAPAIPTIRAGTTCA